MSASQVAERGKGEQARASSSQPVSARVPSRCSSSLESRFFSLLAREQSKLTSHPVRITTARTAQPHVVTTPSPSPRSREGNVCDSPFLYRTSVTLLPPSLFNAPTTNSSNSLTLSTPICTAFRISSAGKGAPPCFERTQISA